MEMSDPAILTLSLIAGLAAGGFFFAGLWYTVRNLAATRHPAALVVFSFLLRVAVVLGAFFLVGRGHIDRMLVCLAGFLIARIVVMRITRARSAGSAAMREEAAGATES